MKKISDPRTQALLFVLTAPFVLLARLLPYFVLSLRQLLVKFLAVVPLGQQYFLKFEIVIFQILYLFVQVALVLLLFDNNLF